MSQREFNWPSLSVTATSGPVQFNKDGAATTVSQSTVTPSNSIPLPTALYNTAGPISLNTDYNGLKVSTPNTDVFGAGVSVQQFNQIEISFDTAPGATLITNTVTSTGSNSIANGHALYSTGTGVTSSSKAVSIQINNYRPLYQSYAAFTAAFTTPTSANSYQRLGLYDANNGFFIGFNGLNFGVTIRTATVDAFTNRTSFNTDLLTGAATSKFTRNGTPEAINLNVSNLYRIRFAWLGSAPIIYEVYSPDGVWVPFHIIKMPNSQLNPSITIPNLPMTLDVSKTAADATNLVVYTACWAAGANSNLQQITGTITDTTLAPLNRSVITGVTTGGGGGYVNVKVNPSGALVADITGTVAATQSGTWTVGVNNFPATQPVSGSVSVSNFPVTQPVSGTVAATQSGTWNIAAVTAITNALPAGTNNIGSITNITGSMPAALGRAKVNQLFNDYSVTSVTTAAYVQLIASTASVTNKLEIFDSSGEVMILAVGAAAAEVDQFYVLPGGNGPVDLAIPSGSRISIKAKTATASVGLIAINLYS